jgi:DNA mismatch repair protein MSH5
VFDVESHANMHNKRNKPGMSLNGQLVDPQRKLTTGVINTTITPLGRKLFHTWLLRPLINIDRINERLDAVQLLSARDYHDIRRNIKRDFKNIKNIVAFCHKIRSGRASWKDWLGLVDASVVVVTLS